STLKAMKSKREQKQARALERLKASVRAKVEHPFRVIKRQFGYVKVRYRGIAKNAAQVLTLFALLTRFRPSCRNHEGSADCSDLP
ncbi:MAG: transposase, partial [Lysobacteraceae bacterium]